MKFCVFRWNLSVFVFLMLSVPASPQSKPAVKPLSTVSHLEVFNLSDYSRTVITSYDGVLEAPVWSRDGSVLMVNKGTLLYTVTLEPAGSGKYRAHDPAKPLNLVLTGPFQHLNYAHGFSPDGRLIAFTDESPGGGHLCIQPVNPGKTTEVSTTLAWFHSWSPSGKAVACCSSTLGDQGIFTLDLQNKKQTRLLGSGGEDYAPDYSPDGRFIYFNSDHSGIMKIWRMRSDGGGAVKVTREDGSDWYAHPSPDGRYVLYLNYVEDQGKEHPFCKEVRIMLLDNLSGYPRQLARCTGGEGTMNMPSWSPDGMHFAFISYECH